MFHLHSATFRTHFGHLVCHNFTFYEFSWMEWRTAVRSGHVLSSGIGLRWTVSTFLSWTFDEPVCILSQKRTTLRLRTQQSTLLRRSAAVLPVVTRRTNRCRPVVVYKAIREKWTGRKDGKGTKRDEQKPPGNSFIYKETWKAMSYLNMKNQKDKLDDQKHNVSFICSFSQFVQNKNRKRLDSSVSFQVFTCCSFKELKGQ